MLHGTDTPDTLSGNVPLGADDVSVQISLGLGGTAEITLYRPAGDDADDLGPLVVLRADEWPMVPSSARLLARMLLLAADRADELGGAL